MSSYFDWSGALIESPISLALLACSVVTFGVALERFLYFRKRSGDPGGALTQARARLERGRLGDAASICRGATHPAGIVAADVLEALHRRAVDLEEIIQTSLSEQKLMLEKNLGVLGSMATAAPLIGLMGTVVGIMRAFGNMARTGSAAPSVVASGVAEALVTTAVGLVIAVPSVLLYNYFSRRTSVMLTVAENEARTLRRLWSEFDRPAVGRSSHHDDSRPAATDLDPVDDLVVEQAAALLR